MAARQLQLALPGLPTFFVDRCLGPKSFAQPLRDLGFRIENLDDHFAPAAEDAVWIPEVTRRDWIILSADFRIRHRGPEIEAFRSCGARMVLLSQKLPVNERVDLFIDARFKLESAINHRRAPWIARLVPDRPLSAPGRRRAKVEFLD